MTTKSLEIDKIKKSDIEYYEFLFKKYYETLIYFAFRYVKDEQIAEDVVHDVFVYIWNNREQLNFSDNFKSYLFTAVRNRSLKHISKSSSQEQSIEDIIIYDTGESNPENIFVNMELGKSIASAISQLPEKRREIFLMHRFDKLTYNEIALTLDISVKTVETQMSRALKYLRKSLSNLIR